MSATGGPNIIEDGLVLSLDAANIKSTLRVKQSSNILVDPNTWTPGTGGFTGYGANGSSSEQNRLYVNDDPWGRTSVTWRTTPDSTSGPDGGWNTSYYSIDRAYTYRWSVWVRRYTAGTGGQFYFGLNPAPIRNDNNASQSNPYFTYPSISSLTQNQWYLVVGHCFYEGYSGGRHPDSGWYANGSKISDISIGNVGAQDVRWASGTTTAMHRAYHFYTTNTSSGIEFAFPRLDKCDGNEPTLDELFEKGESSWKDLSGNNNTSTFYSGVAYDTGNLGSFVFDGTGTVDGVTEGSNISVNESITNTNNYPNGCTYSIWLNVDPSAVDRMSLFFGSATIRHIELYSSSKYFRTEAALQNGYSFGSNAFPDDVRGIWSKFDIVFANNEANRPVRWYQNGQLFHTGTMDGGVNPTTEYFSFSRIGRSTGNTQFLYAKSFHGKISQFKIYNKPLTSQEIFQNYNAAKERFGL